MKTSHDSAKHKSIPVLFLRLEGLALLGFAIFAYSASDYSWWWLALGLFLPDITMVGYAFGNKIGAWTYNIGHSMVLPLLLLTAGYWNDSRTVIMVALIWLAHIGMDRLFGYGLKEKEGFKHTHLGDIGKRTK